MSYTYAETQADGSSLFAPPTHYTLHLACGPAGATTCVEVAPDSANPARFAVEGIPASIRPDRVAPHLSRIAFAVCPDVLMWDAVADLKPGALVRSRRDGSAVVVADPVHWTGRRCIGWLRDEVGGA